MTSLLVADQFLEPAPGLKRSAGWPSAANTTFSCRPSRASIGVQGLDERFIVLVSTPGGGHEEAAECDDPSPTAYVAISWGCSARELT
jgi:hypothetical protein